MYETMKQSFASHANIEVILDRRRRERRWETIPIEVNRRARERRAANIDALLQQLGWVVVEQTGAPELNYTSSEITDGGVGQRASRLSVWLWGQRGRVLSVFLELCRHRVAQAPRLPGQPLELRRSSHGSAILTTDVTDGFEVGEQFVAEGEQLSQHG